MRINAKNQIIEWNGSHTANVYENGVEIEVFTFSFEKSKVKPVDFLSASLNYLEYIE
jgi:hypothetical protein